MIGVRSNSVRLEVRGWWQTTKSEQGLFLRLVELDSVVDKRFDNLEAILVRLEHDSKILWEAEYPESVIPLREHLIHAVENIMESLRNLHDNQLFEAGLRFDIAQVDMNLVQHGLLEYRIVA